MSRKVILPSGAELVVNAAPFKDARSLYQAFLGELRKSSTDPNAQIDTNFLKDTFCILFGPTVEAALWPCMNRCTIDSAKVVEDSFEPEARRADYMPTVLEVAQENILPFMKGLSQQLSAVVQGAKLHLV